jgi:hypothetical protein
MPPLGTAAAGKPCTSCCGIGRSMQRQYIPCCLRFASSCTGQAEQHCCSYTMLVTSLQAPGKIPRAQGPGA